MGKSKSFSQTISGRQYKINIGEASSSASLGEMNTKPDSREDIQIMFVSELGVVSIGGTDNMPTAVLGAIGIQLKNLDEQYNVLKNSKVEVATADGDGFKSAVATSLLDPNSQVLILSPKNLNNVTEYNKQLAFEQKDGFKMRTDGSVKNQARYTITHEYGHMLQQALYAKAVAEGYTGTPGQYAKSVAQKIANDAVKKYGATQESVSRYGQTNSHEFFAEAFASANLGNPNAIGLAMQDWLKSNKL